MERRARVSLAISSMMLALSAGALFFTGGVLIGFDVTLPGILCIVLGSIAILFETTVNH